MHHLIGKVARNLLNKCSGIKVQYLPHKFNLKVSEMQLKMEIPQQY